MLVLLLLGNWLPCISSVRSVTKPTQPSCINIISAFNHRYLHCLCHLLSDGYQSIIMAMLSNQHHLHHQHHCHLGGSNIIIGLIANWAPCRIYGRPMSKYSSTFVKAWHQQPLHISILWPTSYFNPPSPFIFLSGKLIVRCVKICQQSLPSAHFVFLSWKLYNMSRSVTWFSLNISWFS